MQGNEDRATETAASCCTQVFSAERFKDLDLVNEEIGFPPLAGGVVQNGVRFHDASRLHHRLNGPSRAAERFRGLAARERGGRMI